MVSRIRPAVCESNIAAREFDFQRAVVAQRSKPHDLLLECHAVFAVFQHMFDDIVSLFGFVPHGEKLRSFGRLPIRHGFLVKRSRAKSMTPLAADSIVAIECDHIGCGTELVRKVENVVDGRNAE